MSEEDPNTGSGQDGTRPLVRFIQTFWFMIVVFVSYFGIISFAAMVLFTANFPMFFSMFYLTSYFGVLCIPGIVVWAVSLNFFSRRNRILSPLLHAAIATASAIAGEVVAFFLSQPVTSYFESLETGRVDPEGRLIGEALVQLLPVGTILVFPILALILRSLSRRIALHALFFPAGSDV